VAEAHRLGGPGFRLVEKARATAERHGMLAPGDSVLVAVSGGPDSTCLLDVLARLADPLDLVLEVAHVDHGLSEESEAVASAVASRAAEAGFEVHVLRAPDLAGPNLHARARTFRLSFFETVAERIGASRVATGHTLDDRAETTLARLVHGGGTDVLAGLSPADGSRIRPLIECRRAETRHYCEERALEFFDDPGNDDLRFERAAVRRELLPPITRRWGEGAIPAIARSAERLHEDAAALGDIVSRLVPGLLSAEDGGATMPLEEVVKLPRALRRRLFELAVGRVRDRAGGIEAALDALERERKPGAVFAVAHGVEIRFTKDRIEVRHRITT
jgi:tRNA(Ile)-lysidine synthase